MIDMPINNQNQPLTHIDVFGLVSLFYIWICICVFLIVALKKIPKLQGVSSCIRGAFNNFPDLFCTGL